MNDKYSNTQIILAYLAISLLFRGMSFFYSVIDHDESTYIIIAHQLLQGKALYKDLFDTKPAGIFGIFATWQYLFADAIWAIRLLTSLFVAATAYFLFSAKQLLPNNTPQNAFLVGILYIIGATVYSMGLAANTELFFNAFTTLSLFFWLKMHHKNNHLQKCLGSLLSGLAMGIGFVIKYLVLFDAVAFCISYLVGIVWINKGSGKLKTAIIPAFFQCCTMAIGLAVPFSILHLYFYNTDHFNQFLAVTYQTTSRYSNPFDVGKFISFVWKWHTKFWFLVIPFYIAITNKQLRQTNPFIYLNNKAVGIWYIAVWVAVCITGKYFGHYYLQLLPPVCWAAADVVYLPAVSNFVKQRSKTIIAIGITCALLVLTNQYYYYIYQPDIPKQIVADIKPQLNTGDIVFTGNYRHIIYYLLNQAPPTRYVHPSLIYDKQHTQALQINANAELQKITDQHPRFVIIEKQYPNPLLGTILLADYKLLRKYGKEVFLYERIK